jgi:hypothetical protein
MHASQFNCTPQKICKKYETNQKHALQEERPTPLKLNVKLCTWGEPEVKFDQGLKNPVIHDDDSKF